MNEQMIKGKWKEIKGEIQRAWGNLTGDELDRTEGNLKSIAGIIEQKYGAKKDEVSRKLDDIVSRYKSEADRKADRAKSTIADQTEHVKNTLKN